MKLTVRKALLTHSSRTLAGAWIEIGDFRFINELDKSRTLAGAWIEITQKRMKYIFNELSHLSRCVD